MLFGGIAGAIEVRAGADGTRRLSGRFAYGERTLLSEGRGGRLEEQFAARAFQPADEVHLLAHHDFARPLASRSTGTLELRNGDDALTFEAVITPQVAGTSHARDVMALVDGGLSVGLSPGFTLAPSDGAERVERQAAGVLRTVNEAQLWELSVVTRAAYGNATVTARNWTPSAEPPADEFEGRMRAALLRRWRP
jgi:HK97 family phage prohead protease